MLGLGQLLSRHTYCVENLATAKASLCQYPCAFGSQFWLGPPEPHMALLPHNRHTLSGKVAAGAVCALN